MLVSESLSLEAYSTDPRFDMKKPTTRGEPWQRAGDNIYFKDSAGSWQQRPSYQCETEQEHDLSGGNVLIATTFHYFGSNAPLLPRQFAALVKKGPGHIKCTDTSLMAEFLTWLHEQVPAGMYGVPFNTQHITAQHQDVEVRRVVARSRCARRDTPSRSLVGAGVGGRTGQRDILARVKGQSHTRGT